MTCRIYGRIALCLTLLSRHQKITWPKNSVTEELEWEDVSRNIVNIVSEMSCRQDV